MAQIVTNCTVLLDSSQHLTRQHSPIFFLLFSFRCLQVLLAMFEPFGTVTHCTVMMDSSTGQSRGFGFVSYDCFEAADADGADARETVRGRRAREARGRESQTKRR